MTTIIGIKLENRIELAEALQKILTRHGCAIKTRLGIPHTISGECTNEGIILLELTDDSLKEIIIEDLKRLKDIEIKHFEF